MADQKEAPPHCDIVDVDIQESNTVSSREIGQRQFYSCPMKNIILFTIFLPSAFGFFAQGYVLNIPRNSLRSLKRTSTGRKRSYFLINNDNDKTGSLFATTTKTTEQIETNTEQLKEERFIRWMLSDSLDEIPSPGKPLDVIGTIPSYVRGSYVKNGPGVFGTKKGRRYKHVFDGLAKLMKFDFSDAILSNSTTTNTTVVTFTTKFIDSLVKKAMLEYDFLPPFITVGPVEPDFNIVERFFSAMTSSALFDNTPVNVERLSSEGPYIAVTDAPVSMEFDLETLETKGKVKYEGKIRGMDGFPLFSTAHPNQWEGNIYNYFLEVKPTGTFAHIVCFDAYNMRRESVGKVTLDGKIPYVHDFSITADGYAVLCIYPFTMSLSDPLTGAFLPQLVFDKEQSTKIHIFSLRDDNNDNSPIATFETQSFFAYHHVNAYHDGKTGDIILDVLAYEDASQANSPHGYLYMENMKTRGNRMKQVREANVWRFHLDIMAQEESVVPTKTTIMDPNMQYTYGFELAMISPIVKGEKHRYCYGFTGFYRERNDFIDWAILKQDMDDKYGNKVWHEEFSYPGEPIFVPNPETRNGEEDDGVLLCSVYDSRREENYLLVLDAKTMNEIARAYTGISIPSGLHGKFFPTFKS